MTKKHFIQLADALKSVKPQTPCEGGLAMSLQWCDAVNAVANVCADTNAQFDRERFEKACGLERS